MKKLVFLLAILLCVLSACSPNLDLSDEALDLAKSTIASTDRYLDGTTEATTTQLVVYGYYKQFDELEEYGDDAQIKGLVYLVQSELYLITIDSGSDSKLLEKRNDLAKRIGESKKK